VPPSYTGDKQVPLVLLFHGYALGAQLMLAVTQFGAVADTDGFLVASLQGTGDPPAWGGIAPLPGATDVPFVRDVLTKLEADFCIDPDRVFAAGYSNGGGMAQVLACEMGDQIAAVGVVAGLYTNCPARTPLIAFHGTKDPIVPFDGGDISISPGDDNIPPIRRSVSEWAVAQGCDGLAAITHTTAAIELSTYHNCTAGDGEALLYTVIGGGHTWPGTPFDIPADIVGVTTHDIDATATMWQFFVTHPHVR
jgi:polyhydroxybutyrate depolymerase